MLIMMILLNILVITEVILKDYYHPEMPILYPGGDKLWYSIRGHLQRSGAEDYELLYQLGQHDRSRADKIVSMVCNSFDDYTTSIDVFNAARHELLKSLNEVL